jgi:uncharacterized protein (TIGR03067 family)
MSRVIAVGLLSVVVCPAFVAGGARPDDPKAPAELQGTWKLVSVEINGESHAPLGGGEPRWVVKGDKILYGGEEIIKLTADPAANPKVVDLKFKDPDRTYEGIYVIEKDTLKVCVNAKADGAKDRPGKFATQDQEGWRLLVFEREKAPPAKPTEGLKAFAGVQLALDEDTKAVTVAAPIKGSGAEKAGLKKGDVIVKVGQTAATDLDTTVKAVRDGKPGDKIDFVVKRDGKEMTITVTVGVLPFHIIAALG